MNSLALRIGEVALWSGVSIDTVMPYRPYFVALTIVLLGVGFDFAYRPEKEECAPGTTCAIPQNRELQRVSLWVVATLTLVFIVFPYLLPYLPIE
jgi:mercuric ion transport protein